MVRYMKKKMNIKNNRINIGSISFETTTLKNFAFISGCAFLLISSAAIIKDVKDDIREQHQKELVEEAIKNYDYTGPTYKVEYTVNFGDTLIGIVSSYQSDPNKMYPLIDTIVRENNLSSRDNLREGTTITLYGVSEDHLADFGYTLDYSKVNPECELDDLRNFIEKQISTIVLTDENEQKLSDFEARYSYAKMLYDQYKSDENSIELENLLDVYRRLGQEIADIMGINYNNSFKAHKIENEYKGPSL